MFLWKDQHFDNAYIETSQFVNAPNETSTFRQYSYRKITIWNKQLFEYAHIGKSAFVNAPIEKINILTMLISKKQDL